MNKYRYLLIISFLLLILAITILLSLSIGEVSFSIKDIPTILFDTNSIEYGVLQYIRIPRTLLAFAIGGSLSLSGVILQGIYRNPLVEPYTLGISGGASLGVTIALVSGLYSISRITLPLFGFLGALLTVFLVYIFSIRRGIVNVNRMLLIGVMISFISSSLVMFLMSITNIENIQGIVFWTMGSLNETDPTVVSLVLLLALFTLIISYFFVIPLNVMRMGESKARHLGINTQLSIRLMFVLTSLLTGCCIAVAGVIGFVGLIIPHLVRLFVGGDYKILLISSFLSGGIFLILCDVLSRTLIAPNELPIGVITGIFGGIAFLFILSRPQMKSKLDL